MQYKIWEDLHSHNMLTRYPNEELIRFIGQNFFKLSKEERKNIKILEIGIGQGNNIWFLKKEGFDVYGFDISDSAIQKAKLRLQEEGISCGDFDYRFKIGNAKNIPFNMEFDAVLDIGTLSCLSYTEHKQVFKKINNLLKKGGLFFSWHVLKESWGYDNQYLVDKDTMSNVSEGHLKDIGTIYFADYKDLTAMIKENGFDIIQTEYWSRSYEAMTKFIKFSMLTAQKTKDI